MKWWTIFHLFTISSLRTNKCIRYYHFDLFDIFWYLFTVSSNYQEQLWEFYHKILSCIFISLYGYRNTRTWQYKHYRSWLQASNMFWKYSYKMSDINTIFLTFCIFKFSSWLRTVYDVEQNTICTTDNYDMRQKMFAILTFEVKNAHV